jgi:MFS transporter, DHA2 family, multidrug resistance protein
MNSETNAAATPRIFSPWLVAITVTLATFMEILDSSIANIALPHIAGSLGASTDESTWVLTSYLVSSAIVLPLSGWLTTIMGRKRFYMTCVAIFTASSVLCGLSASLPMLIISRILQGAGGGGLQTSEQAILADTFTEKQRGMAFAVYGVAVIVAPAIGPTVGGWITDNYSWHWIFFINAPIGLLSLFLTHHVVHDPPWIKRLHKRGIKTDYVGIALIVVGVGSLQYALDKGTEDDWFSSHTIVVCSVIAAITLVALVIREWTYRDPIMDLTLLKKRNFATSIIFSFALGAVMNGTTIMIPQFMQDVLGYSAERAGMALMLGGFTLMLLMPLAALLGARMDRRYILGFGFAAMSFGLYHLTSIDLDIAFGQLEILRVIQLVGLPFIFVNITTLNYVRVPPEKHNQVSGLSNFSRNIGGAVGVSILNTFQFRQTQIQRANMSAHTNHANPFFEHQLAGITTSFTAMGFPSAQATQKALAQMSQTVDQQASVLSYVNAFWLMAVAVACLIPLVFLLKKPSKADEESTAHAH